MTTEVALARIASKRPELTERDAAQILARVLDSPRTVVDDPWQEHRRRLVRRAMLVCAGSVVAAGSTAAALVLSASSPAVSMRPSAVPMRPSASGSLHLAAAPAARGATVRARLLDALVNASPDVVKTETTISDGQTIEQWSNGAGTKYRSVVSAYGQEPATESLTTISPSGTSSTVIYPAARTWQSEHGTNTQPAQGITAATIESDARSGALTVVGPGGAINGHTTTELALPAGASMIEHLYVDATTYLPIRLTLAFAGGVRGPSSQEDWTYYAPTSSAMAQLTMPIPSGYTEITAPLTTTVPTNQAASAS